MDLFGLLLIIPNWKPLFHLGPKWISWLIRNASVVLHSGERIGPARHKLWRNTFCIEIYLHADRISPVLQNHRLNNIVSHFYSVAILPCTIFKKRFKVLV